VKKDFSTFNPLPYKDRYETLALTQEYALGDVVESPVTTSTGLDVERVIEFESSSDGVSRQNDVNYGRHDVEHTHDDNHALPTSEEHHDDDSTRVAPGDEGAVDDASSRKRLLERDRFERQSSRQRARRNRRERRTVGSTQSVVQRRRRAARRARHVVTRDELNVEHNAAVFESHRGRPIINCRRRETAVSTHHHGGESRDQPHMATNTSQLKRSLATRVQGIALVLYFALLPYVVITKWRLVANQSNATLIRTLLIVLTIFWIGFLLHVGTNVWRLKQGRRVRAGGSAWLAGFIVGLLALLLPTPTAPAPQPTAISIPFHEVSSVHPTSPHHTPTSLVGLGGVPLALMAKRRNDLLRQQPDGAGNLDVDESIDLLRQLSPGLISHLVQRIGDELDGVLEVSDTATLSSTLAPSYPVVACALGLITGGSLVGFAREGGRLPILPSWNSDDVTNNVVALHDGKLLFAQNEHELLRALATRTLRQNVVVYLGAASGLDDELAACAITIQPYVDASLPSDRYAHVAPIEFAQMSDLRVELLRADPQVLGLSEPFTTTLRRRCVEMVAYLALHRRESVTGERLRTRVLTHADVDASLRTLANTASAVRRSLGVDARGPRLHPVTSSGLYVTHGLTSDVEIFSTLIARARQLSVNDAAPLAHQALLLIKGEPLASALRGFEWFLAEGHGARLARDGEWAALALHHSSLQKRNYELAFWALQQGLLIDPYSDALSDALSRVPRLREFGGDGSRSPQDEAVGASGAVAMSWSFARFTQQVTQ